jgi:hypothetical protein
VTSRCQPRTSKKAFPWFTSRSLRRRIAIGVHRDTSVNRGAMLELRLDEQLAVHQFYALLHTGEPQARAAQGRLAVEAHAAIANDEVERIRCPAQLDAEPARTAMSYRVLQGLLEIAEETQRYFRWHCLRHVLVLEVNLRFQTLSKLSAGTAYRCHQPDVLQSGGMQFVRDIVDCGRYVLEVLLQFSEAGVCNVFGIPERAPELFQSNT